MYCEECGKECETHLVDMGIGPYEYWGQMCNDKDMHHVSKCCDADITYNDPEDNHVDEPIFISPRSSGIEAAAKRK